MNGRFMPLSDDEWKKFSEEGQNIPTDPQEWEQKLSRSAEEFANQGSERAEEYHGEALLCPEADATG